MIQFNLLPDVKLEFIKARRNQRLVMGGSLLVIAACVFVLAIFIVTVFVAQRKRISDLNGDIATKTQELKDTPELNKVLTVQNQLKALPELHNAKPAGTRMYDVVQQVTPAAASISQLDMDWAGNKVTITGNAVTLDVVNVYADTLKFTKYRGSGQAEQSEAQVAFKNVVLSQFSRNTSGATYTITAEFDPALFDIRQDIKLEVPKIISTRSATEQPKALFQSQTEAGGN